MEKMENFSNVIYVASSLRVPYNELSLNYENVKRSIQLSKIQKTLKYIQIKHPYKRRFLLPGNGS